MEPEGPRCVSKPFLVPGMIISFCKGLSYIHGLRNQSLETVCSSSGCLSWQELVVWVPVVSLGWEPIHGTRKTRPK